MLYIVVTLTVGILIYLFVVNESGHNHEISKYNIKLIKIGPISNI